MQANLIVHPGSKSAAASAIAVEASRLAAGVLSLRYQMRGRTSALAIPAPADPGPADGLWRATCFEAFVRPAGGRAYYEFNFSPSSQWSAYRFDSYRAGMQTAALPAPELEWRIAAQRLELTARLDLSGLAAAAWDVGLSAVLEEERGKSYWALAHPDGAPDFHDGDCFIVQLAQEPAP